MLRPKPKKTPDARYKEIRSHEDRWAYSVASALHKQRPITVWEVLIPVFLIFNFAKSRGDRQFLAENLMFTKQLALDGAFDIVKRGRSKNDALERARTKTDQILSAEHNGLYSEEIRDNQLREIELLIDHYAQLLRADGAGFRDLVRTAYIDKQQYERFLVELHSREKETAAAALTTLGSRGDPSFTARMEAVSDELRRREAERIFAS